MYPFKRGKRQIDKLTNFDYSALALQIVVNRRQKGYCLYVFKVLLIALFYLFTCTLINFHGQIEMTAVSLSICYSCIG